MSGHHPLSFTLEGLRHRLEEYERRIKNLERRGDWTFEDDPLDDAEFVSRGGIGQMVTLSATADSIASGGDYVTFDTVQYQHDFGAPITPGQTITWPASAVGEVQVELAWETYQGGGTVQVEIDGLVPTWGTLAEATSGQYGWKRRSGHFTEGSTVKIKVTQTSGAAQTCDVFVQYAIPDPTAGPGIFEETLWLDSRVGSVTSSLVLEAGVVYRATVEGTLDGETDHAMASGVAVIYPSPGQPASNDANFDPDVKLALVSPSDTGTVPAHHALFKIDTGSGAAHVEPVGGPYSTAQPGHVYDFEITGRGSAVTFSFADPDLTDNNGQFRIDIVKVV